MKYLFLGVLVALAGGFVFAQTEPATGAREQLAKLLNTPALVKPATAAPLGKNWFRLETDAHVITDEVSVRQVAAVLLDLEHQGEYLNGKKSKLTAAVVSRAADEAVADFVSVSVGPLNIQIKTPYRASVKPLVNTDTKITVEVRQLPDNSAANTDIKNLFATRYAEDLLIDGKRYTYIRFYTIDEVNASILPGAKGALESSSGPINEEILQMIIAAAKKK